MKLKKLVCKNGPWGDHISRFKHAKQLLFQPSHEALFFDFCPGNFDDVLLLIFSDSGGGAGDGEVGVIVTARTRCEVPEIYVFNRNTSLLKPSEFIRSSQPFPVSNLSSPYQEKSPEAALSKLIVRKSIRFTWTS